MQSQIPENVPVFVLELKVNEQDIDDLQHVNNIIYLKWVLEAAQNHWLDSTDEDLRSKYRWVVLRHEIDYYKSAVLHDQLKVVTWVDWHEGVKSLRQVKIFRENQLIAAAKTIWCLLDSKTMRPRRIEEDISGRFS